MILIILIFFYYDIYQKQYMIKDKTKDKTKEVAKIFTVTKDEYDLIEDFINYYSYLFGVHNVYIIDNGSTNIKVLEVYDKFISKGGTIYKHLDYTKGGQGEAFTKYMNIHKNECKFLIGVDTDEFLYLNKVDKPCDRETIIEYLENLPIDITMLQISTYLISVVDINNINYINNKFEYPCRYINYFKIQDSGVYKFFYRGNAFINTGVGNHTGLTTNNKQIISDIGYYHFNHTGPKRLYERAYNIILGYKYINHNDTLKNKILILQNSIYYNGIHRVKMCLYYFLKEYIILLYMKYLKRLPTNKEIFIYIPEIKGNDIGDEDWNVKVDIDNIEQILENIKVSDNICSNKNYDHLLFYESNIDINKYYFNNNLSNCLINIEKIV
jgi:hypothetical protein